MTVHSWGIELKEGWNLISIPLVPTSSDIDDVFADIIDSVAYEGANTDTILQYNAVEEEWNKARPYSDRDGFTGNLDSIVPGYGYWVKVINDTTWTMIDGIIS